jgi:hypothetical protein
MGIPALALVFLLTITLVRIADVQRLTQLTSRPPAIDASSPTGYAGGVRLLIAPGHNNESYQWIAQTQQMIATGEWRLRHVDYDNAPTGRTLYSPSPYRWWLGAMAWLDHLVSGKPIGLSVERAALWADPLLLMLFVSAGTVVVATRFRSRAASVFAVVTASLYPLGGAFLPGCPDDVGLVLILSVGSALTLLAGVLPAAASSRPEAKWFIASGILGGLALWLKVSTSVPLLVGLAIGALAGSWLAGAGRAALPWRTWGIAGAATTLLAWLIEYAPAHLDLSAARLNEVHPLYTLGWLAGGELLTRVQRWRQGERPFPRWRDMAVTALAVLAIAAVPLVMLVKDAPGFLMKSTFAFRLSALGEGLEAGNLFRWLVQETQLSRVVAVALPLTLLVAAGWLWRAAPERRRAMLLVAAPLLIAIAFACVQLSWWSQVDAMLLVLAVALTARTADAAEPSASSAWCGLAAVAVSLPGILPLVADSGRAANAQPTRAEQLSLLERDFAHWLARRAGPDGAIVLAPPNLTVSLFYHGGLRGLGSPYLSNEAGLLGTIRIAGAISPDEAFALAKGRQVTHVVLPAWDQFLDAYARTAPGPAKFTFMGLLQRWQPPRWLQPVPYLHSAIKDVTENGIVVFEVTEVQDQAPSLSRLAEYFAAMGQLELAYRVAQALTWDYGSDLGAQVAKARTEIARGDQEALAQTLTGIRRGLKDGTDEALPWDRRVSLALVLAEGGLTADARTQAQRCMEEMDDVQMRHAPEFTLFRFLTLCRALEIEYADPALRELARALFPPEIQEQI